MKKLTGLFAIIGFILFVGILASCESAGTLKESETTQNQPMIIGKDTVDLYTYWPNKWNYIWVAKVRNQPFISLTYPQGKTQESVIIVGNCNKRVIKGDVLSENDSIVVIKKK